MGNQKMLDLLIRSLDDELNQQEREILKKALSDSDQLRKEKDQLVRMREVIGSEDYQFKHGFENRVMNRLNQPKNGFGIEFNFVKDLNRVFTRVAISGIAAIIILLISIYLTTGSVSLDSLSGAESYSEDNVISYLLYED